MKTFFSLLIVLLAIKCDELNNDTKSGLHSKTGIEDIASDAFTLEDAYIDGDSLKIKVAYSGGCEEHDFTLIWPEFITMIYPPQFSIYVTHDSNGDLCEAYPRETLAFDLNDNPLKLPVDDFIKGEITIVNASNEEEAIVLEEL